MQRNWKAEDRRRLLLCLVIFGLTAALFILPRQFSSSAGGGQVKKGLFQPTKSHEEGLENYDIRNESKSDKVADAFAAYRQKIGKDSALVADIRSDFVRGEEELKSRIPHAKVEYNSDIRTPEVITPNVWMDKIEWLSPAASSSTKRAEILRNFVKENNSLIGVSDEQADNLKVTADYTNPNGYMSFAHLEQVIGGIPVFRGEVKAGFTKDGRIIRVINNLAPGLDYESLSTDFHDPVDAMKAAFSYINKQPSEYNLAVNQKDSTNLKTVFGEGDFANAAEKMYFPTEPGVAVPAWRVLIWQPVNAYYVIVAAEDGRMLWRKNLTEDQTQSVTYNVYANSNAYINVADSPFPLSPGPLSPLLGTQGAAINRTSITRIGNEAPYTFNNNGWITDGNNTTDGNNVQAGLDRKTPNAQSPVNPADIDPDGMATGNPNRVFNFPFTPGNPNTNSGDAPLPAGQSPATCLAAADTSLPTDYQKAAITQLFYIINRYHDEMYRLGFTEPAFNFQHDNFGRGGLGNDRVSGQAQDCSGSDNANFTTPADGTRGSMQMYLWVGPTPDFDGDLDAEVVIHEHTHGLSNRLHGNSSGLSTNMARGLGEGWGDFYGYTMLAEPSDPIDGIYTTGGYATYQITQPTSAFSANYYYGIRRFPRAPITFLGANGKPHNPLTFQYVNSNCATLVGTTSNGPNSAFPRGPIGSSTCDQVHNLGEIWSSALWEVRNRMVARLGFSAGTTRVLQVVTDGMKLAPTGPTFLSERDAIMTAAAALPFAPEAALDVQDVREGFRVRGMGFSSSIQNISPATVTEAFDIPNAVIANPISVSDSTGDNDGFPEPGEVLAVTVPMTNNTGSTATNVVGSITGGGSANYGSIANGATVTRQISYTVPANTVCGSQVTITITGTSDFGPIAPRTFTFQVGVPVGGAPVSFTGGAIANPGTGTTGNAAPYPSTINVSGLTGNRKIKFELTGLNTTYPGDMDWLLVSPGGQKFVVMSDALSSFTTQTNANVVFSDDAAAIIPATGANNLNGTWKPTDHNTAPPTDNFPTPAPASPWESPGPTGSATFASVFGSNGAAMNGTWSLYGVDDVSGDVATITGWKLTFEANDFLCTSVKSRADFDGDGRTDLSVFRPSEGNWYLQQSTAGFGVVKWGVSTDTPTPGDYDGDGKADFAIFRPDANSANPDFYILNSSNFTFSGVSWGLASDIPVNTDYDADGKTDVAVFRPSNNTWYILKSGGGATITAFGQAGDVPVAGDFDGDGKGDLVVYRSGTWFGQYSSGGAFATPFGAVGDVLVPADYNNDNKDDLAVFRPTTGQWIYQPSGGGAAVFTSWGSSGDVPVPGDYDGDGKDDFAIYRNGTWWVLRSTAGISVVNFGVATDKAIPRAYIP